MKTPAILFVLVSLTAGCSPSTTSGDDGSVDVPENTATATAAPDTTAEPVTTAAATAAPATASASASAAPATKTFDLTEHGMALTIDLPADVKIEKRTSKVGGVNIEPAKNAGWKRGITLLEADAAHSKPAGWKAEIAKMKGKILKEDGNLLITFVPENQHGFVLLVPVGKKTVVCQNYGSLENEADLQELIAACKTLKGK